MPRTSALCRPAALLCGHKVSPLAAAAATSPLPLLTRLSRSPYLIGSRCLRLSPHGRSLSRTSLVHTITYLGRLDKRHSSSRSGVRKAATAAAAEEEEEEEGEKNEFWEHEEFAEVVPSSERASKSPTTPSSSQGFFDSYRTAAFAAGSTLPHAWFIDVQNLQRKVRDADPDRIEDEDNTGTSGAERAVSVPIPSAGASVYTETQGSRQLAAQVKLLQAVRELETKLAHAKANLASSLSSPPQFQLQDASSTCCDESGQSDQSDQSSEVMTLTKEDYKGLVDLYYYTHKRRFGPDAPDHSPTPLLLQDYAFKLSEDFAPPDAFSHYYIDEDNYKSPLEDIEKALKSRQMREIVVMQAFVDLLLDDSSSNKALFEVYKQLPSPGVAFLPTGVIRLFLQRMSTPWTKSETAMVRYLSLIDDMQRANLPITRAEWSSAIYLAGRSFSRVTTQDMKFAFKLWHEMEQQAGVQSHHVTFNILFDIAVRAGKFPIAQSMLKEMHDRGLKLNRLGRVSLIFYHGLREDGDAVRKAYRDFVDAGEIVDTLVLTCVMASLFNAGEPTAAEQIYERMKDLQKRFQLRKRPDGSDTLYMRYPKGAHSTMIEREMASNSLDRVLLKAAHLREVLPEHHEELQSLMPLTPNYKTFGTMIAHHANVSGDLNRLTVIMNEMVELFHLPFRSVHFQLLFKGFALHGSMNEHDTWNLQRLDLVWNACKAALEVAAVKRAAAKNAASQAPTLASIQSLEREDGDWSAQAQQSYQPALPKRKKLSPWNELVIDLALFPRQRRRDIERVHSELFDEDAAGSHSDHRLESKASYNQHSSSPQATYYPLGLGHTKLDREEGEYTLPSPVEAIEPHYHCPSDSGEELGICDYANAADETDDANTRKVGPEFRATRPMICWLLRAYSTCSGRRDKINEVWTEVRRLWRPNSELDRQSVYRVLRRCLRDCDRHENYGL